MIAVILELAKEERVEERARERQKPFPPLNGRNIGQTVGVCFYWSQIQRGKM
jgi:hypothetical protein